MSVDTRVFSVDRVTMKTTHFPNTKSSPAFNTTRFVAYDKDNNELCEFAMFHNNGLNVEVLK